jgi:hypothetical protein
MNRPFRLGCVLGAIGVFSAVGVFWSGGFGPCGGSIFGMLCLLSVIVCVPAAVLLLAIGAFLELRPKRKTPVVTS